jgi:hypothetical protein
VAGTTILSASVNSDFSDIATALTQSLATTGVSTMTGQFKGASGSASAPGISFGSAVSTGFYLAGANQIGWSAAGTSAATFNADGSVTWGGAASWSGAVTFNGAATHAGALNINGTISFGTPANFWTGIAANCAMEFEMDGGGAPVNTGVRGALEVPFAFTISRWTLLADQSTTTTVHPFLASVSAPNTGSTIDASAPPALSAASGAQSTTLTGWTTSISSGAILGFTVAANNTATRLTLSLFGQRTGS